MDYKMQLYTMKFRDVVRV